MKNAQTALEYLMSSGWAILVVLVAIGTLAYFGVLSPERFLPSFHSGFSRFVVLDSKVSGSDSPVANSFYLKIASKTHETYNIQSVKIYKDEVYCGEALGEDLQVDANKYAILAGGPFSSECAGETGERYTFDTELTYTKQDSSLTHTDTGKLVGLFESHESYSFTGWTRSDFDGQVSKEESSSLIGSYEYECTPAPPSDISSFVSVTGTIYWDLPQEGRCYSSQAANKGFANVYCLANIPYLSHGWITTELTVSPLLEGHDFYLIGDASYVDEGGQPQNNGICINDNLYFYVNGNLIGKGGTSGIQSSDNKVDAGEEVLRSCSGCSDIDSSAWCIPPVKLTTAGAGFEYGTPNRIMVLVEDFCFPNGYTHAGGLKPFSFYFIE